MLYFVLYFYTLAIQTSNESLVKQNTFNHKN